MDNQLNIFEPTTTKTIDDDINERIHEYQPSIQYWQKLVVGEVCKVTPRWGDNRLCTIIKIDDVFATVKYRDNNKTDFMSLSCLVPVSPAELEAIP